MPASALIDNTRTTPERVNASCDARPSFAALVAEHSVELPGTEWLTRLQLPLRRENERCLSLTYRVSKSLFDFVAAAALLLILAPLMLVVAILIKLTSPGPVIYSQTRVGLNLRTKKSKDRRQRTQALDSDSQERRKPGYDRREMSNYGRPFTIYKFRTMRQDAERDGARLATEKDSRVTPIGRFLRRTRIDELPQLWNILRGDMSLIGPRPERPEFLVQLQQYIPNFVDRLGLKPGMTGIAQVVNGYDNDLEGFRRKVSYDLLYLQNCCLTNDLKILWRTIRVVITGEGAL